MMIPWSRGWLRRRAPDPPAKSLVRPEERGRKGGGDAGAKMHWPLLFFAMWAANLNDLISAGSVHAMGLALVEAHIGRTPLHMPDLRADQAIAVAAARSMVDAALELGPDGFVSLLSWALVSQSLQARAWWTRGEILPPVAAILDLPAKESKGRRGGTSSDGVAARVHPAPGGASALDLEVQWPEGRGRRTNGGAAGDAGPPRVQAEPRWLVIACEARSKRLLEWRALDAAPRAGQAELRM